MRWQRDINSVRKRMFRGVILILLLLGIPTLLFLFTCSLKKVVVEGANHYTEDQIKDKLLKTKVDFNSVLFYLKYNFISKPEIPFVEKLDVELVNNHTVLVTVYEKKIAGCVKFMGEYLYFDKDGMVVESASNKLKNVPEIQGLQFSEIILHQKLKVQSNSLYEVIMNISNLVNKYDLDVDVITFDKNYEITLLCDGVNVLIGKKDYYDEALSDLKNILIKSKGTRLYELDMREYVKGSKYIIGKSKKTSN